MISFKQYFIEKDMSIDHALNLFGLSVNDLGDQDLIKKTFRKLVFKNHPDRGGNEEIMKQLNLAYEVLKKKQKQKQGGVDWDAINKKYQQMGRIIKDRLVKAFDDQKYIKHFNKFSKTNIKFQMKQIFPNEGERSPNVAGFYGQFADDNRDTVFDIRVSAHLTDVVNSNALSFEDLDMKVSIVAIGFFGGKEQKLSKSNWKFTSDHKFMNDPNKVFPTAKLKKIFSGSTSKRKFQKRDMIAFITKKLKGDWDGKDFARIPVGISTEDPKGHFTLTIYRMTHGRGFAYWGVNGLYERFSRVKQAEFASMPEDEQTAKRFEDWVKRVKKLKKADQIMNIINSDIKKFREERDATIKVKA